MQKITMKNQWQHISGQVSLLISEPCTRPAARDYNVNFAAG